MPPDLLTTKQVADILGTNVRRVNRLVKRGELRTALKLEGVTGANLFDPSDVAAYEARSTEPQDLNGDAA
jgi:hypothetical protein